jgi:protein-L-isoaspartate(D-aspartate) O-methyltransferase
VVAEPNGLAVSMSLDAAELREAMVKDLERRRYLSGPRVARALREVPRHLFVPQVELAQAYSDQAIVTRFRDGAPASSASQPAIVAKMLELLSPPVGGTVLEVGAGTGYNAALLAHLVGPSGHVVTVDINAEVAAEARAHLVSAGVANVVVVDGDGGFGYAPMAPFDGIIVTAGASDLSPEWFDQLVERGRLVVPLSLWGAQQCIAFRRSRDRLESVDVCEGGFMPLQGVVANSDRRHPVSGHTGVAVHAAEGTVVNIDGIAAALEAPGPPQPVGVTATRLELFGSFARWLAYHSDRSAELSFSGPAELAASSGVPQLIRLTMGDRLLCISPVVFDDVGFAAVGCDHDALPTVEGQENLALAVCPYGAAEDAAAALGGLLRSWDRAGRPGAERLHVNAYLRGAEPSSFRGAECRARNFTFDIWT